MGDPVDRGAYRFGPFQLDVRERRLARGTEVIPLRLKVFDTLRVLVENAGQLVTKQELLDAVWPDTAVEENNLTHNVAVLRKALGERATGQHYIETVPRVGYRFVAAVETTGPRTGPLMASAANAHEAIGSGATSDDIRLSHSGVRDADLASATGAARPASSERRWRTALVLLAVAIVTAATSFYLARPRTSGTAALTDKDSVLIADFANTTGDEVFDGTLRQAVAVELGQSPFLNIVSEERVRETLRYIGRSPDERVTRDLAREIAQRQGVKVLLIGSIASLGSHYVINLEAVSAASGETVAREQAEAESRERILARLGEAATRLREKLGESLASIERFSAPIEQATTASLEAFKAYDLGRQRHFSGQYFEAIPLYRRAVELDPNFAMAYAALGITYGTAREYDLAAQFSQRAFELRERVSERERFYISARYYMDVLDDGDRAIEVLELWKQTYPRDFAPRTNLSARYCAIGRYQEALEEAREGLRLNPDAGVAYAALAQSSICLGQYREAGEAIEQALARKLDATLQPLHAVRDRIRAGRRGGHAATGRPRFGNSDRGRDAGHAVGDRGLRRPSAPGERADETGHRTGQGSRPGGRGWPVLGRRRLVGGGVRQLPGGEAGRNSNPHAVAGAVCPELERAGRRDLRRYDPGQEAGRRDGPAISPGLVFQGLLAPHGGRRGLTPTR